MSNRPLYLDKFIDSVISISKHQEECFDINNEHQKMLKVLVKAIDGELTPRQKQCLTMYYGKNMRIVDISRELNVYPSTVSRHIKKARSRLKIIIGYYFSRLSS